MEIRKRSQWMAFPVFLLVGVFFFPVFCTAGSADGVSVTVDAAQMWGDAGAIQGWMGVQGVAVTFSRHNPGRWSIQAWRALELNSSEIGLFDENDGISVTRNAQGKLELDFTNLDAQLDFLTKTLGQTRILFSIGLTPRALSSNAADEQTYWSYAPENYEEWSEIVSRAVEHLKKRGHAGASYQTISEPESYSVWRGKPGREEDDLGLLQDYVELYVSSWHGVKRADPAAKVGGPMTGVYSSVLSKQLRGLEGTEKGWGLDDFIKEVARYNRKNPQSAVTLDEVIWQDYDWVKGSRLADGVRHVRKILKANGFPVDTPQVIVGWNTDYGAYEPVGSKSLLEHANYVAGNILEQLNMGKEGISRAYLWPLDYDHDPQFKNIAAITLPYPEQRQGGEPGTWEHDFYGPTQINPAVTEYCKRPKYAVLEMLKSLMPGRFVRLNHSARSGVEGIAVRDDSQKRISMVLVNRGDSDQIVRAQFTHLPFGSNSLKQTIRRIDATHSADCNGLEKGQEGRLVVTGDSASVTVSLSAYAIVQVVLTA